VVVVAVIATGFIPTSVSDVMIGVVVTDVVNGVSVVAVIVTDVVVVFDVIICMVIVFDVVTRVLVSIIVNALVIAPDSFVSFPLFLTSRLASSLFLSS